MPKSKPQGGKAMKGPLRGGSMGPGTPRYDAMKKARIGVPKPANRKK